MTAEAAQSTLRRKTNAHESAVGPAAMDTSKAFRVSVARAGDSALDIAIGMRELSESALIPEDLAEGDPETEMYLRLESASGAHGLAIIRLQAFSAVVEASTLAMVLPVEASARKPTSTDAALLSTFLDSVLGIFGGLTADIPRHVPVTGYSVTGTLPDTRAAKMYLSDVLHKQYDITLDFGLGAKVGDMTLIFPTRLEKAESNISDQDAWAASLEKAVLGTSAQISAELCTLRLSFDQISKLQVGDMVPLTNASLDGLTLVGPGRQKVMNARLGRSGSARAVRVTVEPPDSSNRVLDNLSVEPARLPPAAPPSLANTVKPMQIGSNSDALGAIETVQVPASEAKFG